jgi:acetyl/propionyl-CoA carboxylase alpha subunit/acetyl-CoA carboxylase carboxyltransferase component
MNQAPRKNFERIAIVNRGEPAMRLIRAVREWNVERGERLRTIAFYTEPDREALFVREADGSFCLGSAMFFDVRDLDEAGRPRRKSRYLDYPKLREALIRSGADAAWVGWGFVAEHAAFAELCAELEVTFIGPTAEAMRKLGDKIGSKRLAEKAGVPVSAWSGGPVGSLEEARTCATRIGYPLLVKATAGGGGRGIRFVQTEAQLAEAFASASAEAAKAFGDGTVFLEAKVEAARHVEVQILADEHGTVWPAGVRDCTAQRCNQKVIEEAPCPALSPAQERAIREAAVRLSREAGYRNAGTVEFLFEPEAGRFHFMEMNTRLQVEHPVTEATTGLDLVRLQIAIARGEKLPEEPPPTRGHAIEVRLCAEDPDRGFAPAPGKVVSLRPAFGPGVRTDSGVLEGDSIPVEFDSMIAKVIACGATREEARARLARALLETLVVVEGGTTNRAFLLRLLNHPDFTSGDFDTKWIDRLMQQGETSNGPDAQAALIATAIALHERQLTEEELNFFASAARGRPSLPAQQRRPIELRYQGVSYEFSVSTLEPGSFRVQVEGGQKDVRLEHDGPYEARLSYDTPSGTRRHRVVSVPAGLDHLVEVDGCSYRISRDPGGLLRAPAPGLVLSVHVAEGAEVRAGDRLLGLEAMKMEMPVTAPFDGRVRRVLVGQSVQVAAGDPLLVLEPSAAQQASAQASARLAFPRDEATPAETPQRALKTALRELRRLMLGFHISDERVGQLLATWSTAFPDAEPLAPSGQPDSVRAPPPDLEAVRELLALYLDVATLFSKQYSESFSDALRLSHEQYLHIYLREVQAEGKGLPEELLSSLRSALAHFGVSSLADSSRLRDALVWLHRAHQNIAQRNRVVLAVLQFCLDRPAWREAVRDSSFRELLDRLVDLTQEVHPRVCDSAQQVRYALFEGREFEERRREALRHADLSLEKLRADPQCSERSALMSELVAMPFELVGHLTSKLETSDDALRALVLETMTRRYYRNQPLGEPCLLHVEGRPHLLTRSENPASREILATWAPLEGLDAALTGLSGIAGQLPERAKLIIDLYLTLSGAPDEKAEAEMLAGKLPFLASNPRIQRICAIFVRDSGVLSYHTFNRANERFVEDQTLRGFHPTTGERLEVWRMRNFSLQRVTTRQDLHLFYARAHQNERDERFLAVVEVREAHPVHDGSGRLKAVPEMEHAVLEALQAIREQQARRDARRRLQWNRVTVFLRPPVLARRDEVMAIARRLHPSARNLGLEKISLRVLLHEDTSQVPRDTVISLFDRTGHRLEMSMTGPHNEPLRALDDYGLKLIRARQRHLTYVYEIVKMLAPMEASPDFPRGEFEEYDLGSNGDSNRLVSVKSRPYGRNTANVVMGVVQNFTPKHPEGMTRVVILGDGTREMGALAEPECRRIIAAIDLAQKMEVPLEWFPISSGAKIAMDSGTENLDWTAAVLKRIIEFTQGGGEINIVVDGINVGAQSYWNAEATMLMHTRGCLIMTPRGTMLLTGKRALDYSGGISAEDNLGIGGFERIMGPNGQAQYHAHDLDEACRILLRYYEHTYRAPGERHPRLRPTEDPRDRNVCVAPYPGADAFATVGDLWSDEKNPGRKKPFDVRTLLRAVADSDAQPLERWPMQLDGEVAVVWDSHLGGWPVCLIGIESKPLSRLGYVPSDGPDTWSGGTLFPMASKKVARAINAASGNRPGVVIANLSGFDGSPESLRRLQLEFGAEIGRAVVNFKGPLVFCVVARYHGGAYVVFSKTLNPSLQVLALSGCYASVIGGAPAAAVVFPEEVRAATLKDARIAEMEKRLKNGGAPRPQLRQEYEDLFARVHAEKQREIAERFDSIHCVQRALQVGSLDAIVEPRELRSALIEAIEAAYAEKRSSRPRSAASSRGTAKPKATNGKGQTNGRGQQRA